jgi:hypothetical protein
MGFYRKKPVVVEAIQFTYSNIRECKEFVGKYWIEEESNVGTVGNFIETLEGTSYLLSNNDWIIKGVEGEFYPCKPDIFEKTYQEVWE